MNALEGTDLWKQIPPEEKIELMNRAQSKGILAVIISIIIGSTIAVGLQVSPIMWTSLIISPFIFQFTAGKSWRGLRPRVMLEYLAARAAARRYAFTNNSKELTVQLIFRGELNEVFDEEHRQESLEAEAESGGHRDPAVWVALFTDVVVMMAEKAGGAEQRFGHLLNDKLEVTGRSPDGGSDYSNNREVLLSMRERTGNRRTYKLTSNYPAALIVFEKKLLQFQADKKREAEAIALPEVAEATGFGGLDSDS